MDILALFFGGIGLVVLVVALLYGFRRVGELGEDDPTEEFIEALQKQAAKRRADAAAAQVLSIRKRTQE